MASWHPVDSRSPCRAESFPDSVMPFVGTVSLICANSVSEASRATFHKEAATAQEIKQICHREKQQGCLNPQPFTHMLNGKACVPGAVRPQPTCALCAVLGRFSRVRLRVTPRTAARQAPLSMGFSRQGYWSGLPCPPPGDLPDPGSNPDLLHCRQILYLGTPLISLQHPEYLECWGKGQGWSETPKEPGHSQVRASLKPF